MTKHDPTQTEVLLELRYRIDTATTYPFGRNIDEALAYANEHAADVRSTHVRRNLGQRRWSWLDSHGFHPVGEATEIAGLPAVKITITPEVTK